MITLVNNILVSVEVTIALQGWFQFACFESVIASQLFKMGRCAKVKIFVHESQRKTLKHSDVRK